MTQRGSSHSASWEIREGDCRALLAEIPDESVNLVVTSPPYYGLRDYGIDGQIGLEPSMHDYIAELVAIASDLRRVLAADGTFWLNLGDTFSGGRNGKPGPQADVKHPGRTRGWVPPQAAGGTGLANKQMCGVPWRVALALQDDGWWIREDVIWSKPNAMPENVADRCTRAHEYLFRLTKGPRYYADMAAISEASVSDHASGNGFKRPERVSYTDKDGARGSDTQWANVGGRRNKRSVWEIPTEPFADAHFATFPPSLVSPCVRSSSRPGDLVLDPFSGAATTGLVALQNGRRYLGLELNPEYAEIGRRRLAGVTEPIPGLEVAAA